MVTKREILAVIVRLAYVAVNLNLKIVQNLPETEDKRSALEYHKRIAKNRKAFLQNIGSELPEQVDCDGLHVLLDQFYRSYDLRMAMAGDINTA